MMTIKSNEDNDLLYRKDLMSEEEKKKKQRQLNDPSSFNESCNEELEYFTD